MYFPYLRGRQFELIALRELLENDLIGDKIVPIIEPVKPTPTLARTLKLYTEKEHKHALIMNPEVGEFVSKIREKTKDDSVVSEIYDDLKSDYFIRAYIMKKTTPEKLKNKANLEDFMIINPKRDCMEDFLNVYSDFEPQYTLIPDDRNFIRKVHQSKILFTDKFQKATRNSEYSQHIDEFFF